MFDGGYVIGPKLLEIVLLVKRVRHFNMKGGGLERPKMGQRSFGRDQLVNYVCKSHTSIEKVEMLVLVV